MAMRIEPERCTGCGVCLPECPNDGIVEVEGLYHIRAGYCTECYAVSVAPRCVEVCPVDAVESDPEWPDDELAIAARAFDLTPALMPRD